MDKRKLKGEKFEILTESFMDKIWEQYKDRLPEDAIESLITYLGDLPTNSVEELEEIYEKASGNSGLENLWLAEEELFTLVIEFCAKYIYKWNFKMKEVLTLLFAMRYDSENHKEVIEIWKELINAIE